MQIFEVRSNESVCRKSGRLGLEQVSYNVKSSSDPYSAFFFPHHKHLGPYLQVEIHPTRQIIKTQNNMILNFNDHQVFWWSSSLIYFSLGDQSYLGQ